MPIQRWLYTIPLRLRSLFRRSRVEQDLDDELRYHLEQQVALFVREGMSPEDARVRAGRVLGGLERRKEECRDLRGISLVEHVLRDAVYALRTLRRDAGFTLGALAILALGIGASGAVYAVTSSVLTAPLPYRNPERLVIVRELMPSLTERAMAVNPLHFREWQANCACFDGVALLFAIPANLSDSIGSPERVLTASVTPNLFALLGVEAQAGRTFRADDAAAEGTSGVVISDGLWRRRFGADPAVVGRSIDVNGVARVIVGVLPRTFRYYFAAGATPERAVDVYQAWAVTAPPGWQWQWAGNYSYDAVARVRRNVSPEAALAELNVLQAGIAQRFERGRGQELRAQLVPLHDWVTGGSRTSLLLLIAAVAMAFLAGCVNIANLMLTRATGRAREAAVRAAIGASRLAIFRTVLIESTVLSLAGAAAGFGVATVLVRAFVAAAPPDLPRVSEIQMDWTALLIGAGLFIVATLTFGLLPATRLARADPHDALRAAGPSVFGGGRLRQAMVSLEVALSAALLVAAGLLLASFVRLNGVDRGFDPDRALAADFNLPPIRYPSPAARIRFYEALLDRLQSSSVVEAAGVTSILPLRGLQWGATARAEGDSRPWDEAVQVQFRWVSAGYFQAMGLPVREGRTFLPEDRGKLIVVLSEGAARRLWPNGSAVGRRVSRSAGGPLSEVVGVVPDVHSESLEGDPGPLVYAQMSEPQGIPPSSVVVRIRGEASAGIGVLREAVASLDPQLPLANIQTLRQFEGTVLGERRFQLILIASFAVTSLLLAAIGTYSVVAYAVSRRAREIALRLALGSSPALVRRMILRQGLRPVLLGLVLGLLAALLSGRLVAGLLFGVEPTDPATILAVSAVMLAAATLACWIPARRVVQTSILSELRYE